MSTFRFLWVVVSSGAIVMALEILSARILSPTFGNSVYVWGSVISVFLAALSIGYLWGGSLADRQPKLSTLGQLLLLVVLLEVVLLHFGVEITEGLGRIFGTSRYGALATTALLFGPITTLLATVSPFAVRLAAKEVESLGNVSGRLYALSTAGSLAGTLGCTFILIPFLDVRQALFILIVLTAVTAVAAMGGEGRAALPVVGLIAVALTVASVYTFAPDRSTEALYYRRMTPYQTLEVRDSEGVRTLTSDGRTHSAESLATGESTAAYARNGIIPLLFNPEIHRIAVLGMGAGSYDNYIRKFDASIEVDNVEIDPAVLEVAEEFFGFVPTSTSRVIIQDARRFLDEVPKGDTELEKYDLIFSDTYLGLSVPFHLTTVEFVALAKKRLTADGILMINVAANLEHPFAKALYSTVASVFGHTYLFECPRPSANHLVVATNSTLPRMQRAELVERAKRLESRFPYVSPSLVEVANDLVEIDLRLDDEQVLRDSFAPVDHLIHLGQRQGLGKSPSLR
ncbi:MAG: fused MFS/spermidine synthase [Thermoanaerobaculia bacterium]|nr:fused MFS/spermidine synthase [Thermoanaerobaculia bacterium]